MLHFWRPLFSTLALSCGSGCLVLPTHPLANTFTPPPPLPPLPLPPHTGYSATRCVRALASMRTLYDN